MSVAVVPFPYGAREGELVLRIVDAAGLGPDGLEAVLDAACYRAPRREIWIDAAEIAGPEGHRTGMLLRRFGDVVMTATTRTSPWPRVPGRIVVDVSEELRGDNSARSIWLEELAGRVVGAPQADELYAVDPAPEMLDPEALHQLDYLTGTLSGGTLYVPDELVDRAVAASARAPTRPWIIRRLGSLPPAARGRVASTAA